MDLLDSITAEDLPNDVLQHVAETCGLDVAKSLLLHCAGMRIDIPLRPKRDAAKRYIELHYTGTNAQALAAKIGMSERFVYKVLKEKSAMRPAGQAPGPYRHPEPFG